MGVLQEVEKDCMSVIVSGPSCYTIIGASVSMDFCNNDSCQKIWENCLFAFSLFLRHESKMFNIIDFDGIAIIYYNS